MAANDYTYKAIDSTGENIVATIRATNVEEASKMLIAKNLYPYSVEPYRGNKFNTQFLQDKLKKISANDRVIFTRQLATLIKAGLPIASAMRLLIDQMENVKMQDIVRELSISIEAGNSLAEGLQKYPDVFSKVYVNVVSAGEVSGNLDDTLSKLATQEEKNATINRKIKGALTYPIVVLVVVLLVSGLMITVVLPEVGKIYTELNRPIPAQTNMLLGLASFLTKFWFLILFGLAGMFLGVRSLAQTDKGRRTIDRFKLNIPGFKTLIRKVYMTRFTSTLSSLINSGVPMLQSLEITANSINNIHLEESIRLIAQRVKSGATLSKPIEEDENFLPLVGKMISVGEETGSIGDSLAKVTGYYEEEVDQAIDNLSSLIEPATMILLGGMIAFLVAAVLLPIYGLVNGG
ncbi:TPA: type II secretion system F family protein [Candidatus Saccharibacteria bacterium]|nr:type II secretion system F family protein [Candidatus Saccharibacteria bacterium]HIO87713.1 type II secretion system F family protein [Candidatus Saccharibacteria bacterium]